MADIRAKRAKLSDLVPDDRNANAGTVRGLAMLDDSLREDGAGRGILLDRNNKVVAGNKTLERAVDLGFEEVIIVPTDGKQLVATQRVDVDIDSPQGRRMALRDNRVAEVDLAWNPDVLQGLMNDGIDLSTFFDADELDTILAGVSDAPPGDPGAQVDKAAELQEKWQVKPGDLWTIGEHRLLCGDSTRREDVERVMAGERIALVIADPPYGVSYGDKSLDGKRGHTPKQRATLAMKGTDAGLNLDNVANDNDPSLLLRWIETLSVGLCEPNWNGYVFAGDRTLAKIITLCGQCGIDYHQTLVWVKDCASPGFWFYKYLHELIAFIGPGVVVFGTRSDAERWYGEPSASTVLAVPSIQSAASRDESGQTWFAQTGLLSLHPTQKPAELIARLIRNSSTAGEIIHDPFLGSGTTLVACEQTGRRGRGIEIEPKYCAVTLDRLARMGLAPRRESEGA